MRWIDWLEAFGLTLLIELPIYLVGLRPMLGTARALLAGVGVNLLTHPALWLIVAAAAPVTPGQWLALVLPAEVAIWAVESLALITVVRLIRGRRPDRLAIGLWAAVANLGSFVLGLILQQL